MSWAGFRDGELQRLDIEPSELVHGRRAVLGWLRVELVATIKRSIFGWGLTGAVTIAMGCFDPEAPPAGETGGATIGTSTTSDTGTTMAAGTTTSGTSGLAQTSDAPEEEATSVVSDETSSGVAPADGSSEEDSVRDLSSSGGESSGGETAGTTSDTTSNPCTCGPYEVCFPDGCTPAHVVYLNFDAEGEIVYSPGSEDATQNVHGINQNLSGTLEGYGAGSKREDVLEAVREDFLGYRVVITDTRPEEVDYSMIVFTPSPPGVADALFSGAPDCNNAVRNSLAFVHLAADDASPAAFHANLVTRTIAMGIGLEPVTDENDVLSATVSSGDEWFHNTCETIASETPACAEQHEHFCDDGTQQDAHRELELVFGWQGSA